jgi:hypothetical protein
MEPECSLPHSQVRANCLYPEPTKSSPYPHIILHEDSSEYYPHIYAWVSPVVSFPQFSHQNHIHTSPFPIRATYPAYLVLLDFITPTIMGKQYRLSSTIYYVQTLNFSSQRYHTSKCFPQHALVISLNTCDRGLNL